MDVFISIFCIDRPYWFGYKLKKTYVVLWPWGPLNNAHGRGAHGFSAVEGKGGDEDHMEDRGFSDGNASNMELPQLMVEMEVFCFWSSLIVWSPSRWELVSFPDSIETACLRMDALFQLISECISHVFHLKCHSFGIVMRKRTVCSSLCKPVLCMLCIATLC